MAAWQGCTWLETVMHVEDAGLIEATQADDVTTVKRLLDQGANPDYADEHGITPLSLATLNGNRQLVVMLIAAGADVRARDVSGRTALHHAASSGQTLIAVRLLMHGLDPVDTSDNHSAIDIASLMGHRQLALILFLASRADLNRLQALVRSVSANPTFPTDDADHLIINALLNEKGIDSRFEPLATVFLREMRNENSRPKRLPPPRNRSERSSHSISSVSAKSKSRAERFTGVPPQSIGINRTWLLRGSDDYSEKIGQVEDMFLATYMNVDGKFVEVDKGSSDAIVRQACSELHRVRIESGTALDLLNEYYQRALQATGREYFGSLYRATIMLYTDNRFYQILNQHWRNQKSEAFFAFSTLMSMAFRQAKYFMEGEVYRGVDLTDIDHYRQGLIFRWPFFISASMNRDVATAFGKTLVTIEVPGWGNVREIDRWSLFPEESEVLLRAYELFEVLESGPAEVRLRIFQDEFFGMG